jgi:large subunit ribosomal protein L2
MKYSCYRSIDFLRKHKKQFSGRNQQGHITVRHRGGGHKQAFRQIN